MQGGRHIGKVGVLQGLAGRNALGWVIAQELAQKVQARGVQAGDVLQQKLRGLLNSQAHRAFQKELPTFTWTLITASECAAGQSCNSKGWLPDELRTITPGKQHG